MNRRGFIGLFAAMIATPMAVVSGKRKMVKRKILKTKPDGKYLMSTATAMMYVAEIPNSERGKMLADLGDHEYGVHGNRIILVGHKPFPRWKKDLTHHGENKGG